MRNVIYLILVIFLSGCTALTPEYMEKTTKHNFRKKVKITDYNYHFASAERPKSQKICFPPSENPICDTITTYPVISNLNLKYYTITMNDNSFYTTQEVEDLIYLVAAQIALQNGYSKFIVTQTAEFIISDNPSSEWHTSGVVINDIYHARTYSTPAQSGASSSYSIDIVCFNNYEEIKNGVFIYNQKMDAVKPFVDLYRDEKNAQELKRLLSLGITKGPYFTSRDSINPIIQAWKSYYESEKIQNAIIEKYSLSKVDYKYEINSKTTESKEKTIQEKYKISNQ